MYRIAGNFRGRKFSRMLEMSISRIIFSRISSFSLSLSTKTRHSRKFSPAKISRYTVFIYKIDCTNGWVCTYLTLGHASFFRVCVCIRTVISTIMCSIPVSAVVLAASLKVTFFHLCMTVYIARVHVIARVSSNGGSVQQ